MPFTFDAIQAFDPTDPRIVAANTEIIIHLPGDPSLVRLDIADTTGVPLPNPYRTNDLGAMPSFIAPVPRVAWTGGGLTGFLTSFEALKDEALAAAASAQASLDAIEAEIATHAGSVDAAVASAAAAAESAEAAAALVGAPTADAVAAAIGPGGGAEPTLSAAIGGRVGFKRASDYPSFQTAVDEAYAAKLPLLMNVDVTTPSLSSAFWSVTGYAGAGSVTVGSGTPFWPNPAHTGMLNRLYYNSTTGSDSNSGLDPANPVKSFARVVSMLNTKKSIWRSGQTELVIQAGTHKDSFRSIGSMGPFTARLRIRGEIGSFGEKASILDGTGTSNKVGIWLEPGFNVEIRDLKITNWKSPNTQGDDAPDTGAGIVYKGKDGGDALVDNVEVSNCSQGIGVINQSKMTVVNSTITDCATGVRALYNSTLICGAQGMGNTISNCTMHGVFISRNAIAHVDYNTISGCAVGTMANMSSRFAVLGGAYINNIVGVRAGSAAEMVIDTATTFTGNGIDREFWGAGREERVHSMDGTSNEFCLYKTVVAKEIVGTTKASLITTGSNKYLPPGYFIARGQKIRYHIAGNTEGAGAREFEVQLRDPTNGANINKISFTLPAGVPGAAFTRYVADIELYADSRTSLKYSIEFRFHGGSPYMLSGTAAVNTTYPWYFALWVTNSASTDKTVIRQGEIYSQG